MKILLISPKRDYHLFTNRGILIPQLSLLIIKGLTPAKHEVKIVEEEHMQLNLDEQCDIVGISCMTSNAYRGYRIADAFRERNKIVVMGGVHPSILPEEALQHADAVVVGEAEGVWETILEDIESNNLQRIYNEPDPDLNRHILKDFSILPKKRFYNLVPLQTKRGCPYNCDFCCVSKLFGKKIKEIPINNVVKDIRLSGSRNFIFLDDNIIADRAHAKNLFKTLIPLKIKWVGQSSIAIAQEDEILKLAKKSGCRALFIGLESVMDTSIKKYKKLSSPEEIRNNIRKILKMGIIIHASIIFGFDEDTQKTFDETLNFLIRNRISIAAINVLTPYPGTQVYKKFRKQGKLLHENWGYYDHHTVVFQPKNMTPLELQIGKINVRNNFSSIPSIIMRFIGNLRMPVLYLITNLKYRKYVLKDRLILQQFKSGIQQNSMDVKNLDILFAANNNTTRLE